MKRSSSRTPQKPAGRSATQRVAEPAAAATRPGADRASEPPLATSPRLAAQRQRLDRAFGTAAQRAEAEEEELQMKRDAAPVQRAGPEDEELLQGRFTVQRAGLEEEEPLQGHWQGRGGVSVAQTKPGENRTGMPDDLKAGVEALSGMDLSAVRVHRNSPQPEQLAAHAYAQGNDIHLAPGQEQHLPHEAWHIVQQRQGRVAPTTQLAGTPVNDDAALEAEADSMGDRARHGR
ncbi:MAG: DUF4157 domain-containing protein [Betaproteobacteria bacterium]|nr:DUF4157 domain-containing protein [Betaproteobacteria bacterium]